MTAFKKLVEITYGEYSGSFEKPSWWDDYQNEHPKSKPTKFYDDPPYPGAEPTSWAVISTGTSMDTFVTSNTSVMIFGTREEAESHVAGSEYHHPGKYTHRIVPQYG